MVRFHCHRQITWPTAPRTPADQFEVHGSVNSRFLLAVDHETTKGAIVLVHGYNGGGGISGCAARNLQKNTFNTDSRQE